MPITIKPGRKPEQKSDKDNSITNLRLASDLIGVTSTLGKSLRSAASLRDRSRGYANNAELARMDARDAVRVGNENASIVNLERYRKKGEQLSYFAGSGFAAGSGSYADTIAFTESEYAKTMATIHFEAEAAKNALEFEARQAEIQSEYMRKVASIQSRTAILTGIAGIVTSVSASQIDKEKD